MHYGTVETWDPETKQGSIFCADYKSPLRFTSDRQWRVGDLITFRVDVIAVSVEPIQKASPCSIENVPNTAADAAAESFKHVDVRAYFGQYGNKIDCGEMR